ncbi:MAG: hypothetical protein HRU12_16690 [Phaeodactylibacter sp.]|nr:hypothetical protein [Phaeodactylibacter sp.]
MIYRPPAGTFYPENETPGFAYHFKLLFLYYTHPIMQAAKFTVTPFLAEPPNLSILSRQLRKANSEKLFEFNPQVLLWLFFRHFALPKASFSAAKLRFLRLNWQKKYLLTNSRNQIQIASEPYSIRHKS